MMASARGASAGMNLSWNDCGAFGSSSAPLTCTTNTGILLMLASITPSAAIPEAIGQNTFIQVGTSGTTVSPWWDLREGTGCRPVSLELSLSFGTLTSCVDPWQGQASAAHQWLLAPFDGVTQPNRARLQVVSALPASTPVQLDQGIEYYLFEVIIDKQKTVGIGSCSGCTDDATFFLSSVTINQASHAPGSDVIFNSGDNNICIRTRSAPSAAQCEAVPALNRTWGSLKATYR